MLLHAALLSPSKEAVGLDKLQRYRADTSAFLPPSQP
jgi:hypothetical protein